MSSDPFWAEIDRQLVDLKTAKTADDVFRICPPQRDLAADNAQGFFAGGGGDGTVLDALLTAGWKTVSVDAWYYWVLRAPNGDLVTYVEGDLYRGNQMLPHGEPVVEEHAFVPGDGESTHRTTCQFPGCGHDLSEHEEGEPCCIAFVTSGGTDHEPDCKEKDQ